MHKIAKCLVGYTYSDEENLENIFNKEEEVIDYFTSKVVMENRSKDNTKKVEEQIK